MPLSRDLEHPNLGACREVEKEFVRNFLLKQVDELPYEHILRVRFEQKV